MNVDDIAPPRGDAVKFERIGDMVRGVLIHVGKPEMRPKYSGDGTEEVAVLVLDTADGNRSLYVKTKFPLARAIAEAVRATGRSTIDVGATLAVKFTSTQDTGKGQPLKLFAAQYEPPAQSASVAADDLF